VTALVRADDRPRYYASLFAPPSIRNDLLAIYGFAAEVARVPNQIKDPTLGEIRLKWWRDALVEAIGGGGGETPSLRAVGAAITRLALPIAPFVKLVEARSADLYADPPATLADLEGLMGETESVLFQMAAIASGAASRETADASGHAGVAYGIARRLSIFASSRARGRMIIPGETLAECGASATDAFAAPAPPGVNQAIAALVTFARRHLALARNGIAGMPAEARFAFLPLAIASPLLERAERLGPAIAEREITLSDIESLTRIGWARLRG
jgi:phytoene synthase